MEFAVAWVVLWLLFSGVYQFGYGFYCYNVLMTAVTNAATLGAKLDYDTGASTSYTTSLQNMVVYGDTSTGSKTQLPGLTTANVNVAVTLVGGYPADVTVSIQNFTVNAIFASMTWSGKPRATFPYVGHVLCASC